MTSKKEIEDALNKVIKKFDDPKLKARFLNYTKTMQFSLTDINTKYLIKIKNGEVESLKEESIDSPDINVIIESGILIDILNKKMNPMKAYTTGKLKAKGKLTDLLNLQKFL